MVNTKTQKQLSISKTKSELINDWFINVAHWKILSEELELGKTAIFKYKKKLADLEQERAQELEKEAKNSTEKKRKNVSASFEALSEIFTLKQINTIIVAFNDYVEHPEKYEKPKKKSEVDLEEQEQTVKKHMKDMNMDYLSYDKQSDKPSEDVSKAGSKEAPKEAPKEASKATNKEVNKEMPKDTNKTANKTLSKNVSKEAPKEASKAEPTATKKQTEDKPSHMTVQQLLAKQEAEVSKEREEINKLPVNSPERAEKEAAFQRGKARRMNEYHEVAKQNKKK
ncbi:hypothetical protein M4L90_14650 [Staphylococcus equorum]|uniref:Uncharacterized protein n=1 Tax=Staphylococcus equorum TaxID=246432 RepID=A0A9X4L606_9STAP|nr:hypothetical protein [Staphylococcus equorum]MDG0841769.1 hypothetical protein [Staphylococcus equorum]MDG0847485.1 hypothetical protein [Staphylococcus equorum]PTE82251.1 hypothetical protein BUY85_00510 [Staphylococcus equorum]PTE82339.1 hypothetical protein BUY85_00955 [Staphylococcus equorum]